MKIHLLAIGQRMPTWVSAGYEEYAKRLPRECSLVLHELPMATRTKNATIEKCLAQEAGHLLAAIPPHSHIVTLEVQGSAWNTETLAKRLQFWLTSGQSVTLLIGGPDGLAPACLEKAAERWSLSALTLPHPLVRLVVAEQLYRAWTLLSGHPYHRA